MQDLFRIRTMKEDERKALSGVTQPLTRILYNKNFLLPNSDHQFNINPRRFMPCAGCDLCHVSETGRCFETSKKEHIRNVKTWNIAKHAWSFDHCINFDNSSVIDKGSFRIRRLGTPLVPSMLTITLSQFLTSIVFFLNSNHLMYTFMLCFVVLIVFISPSLAYISLFCISVWSVAGCRLIAESSF